MAFLWPFGAKAEPWKQAEQIAHAGIEKEGIKNFKLSHTASLPPDCFWIEAGEQQSGIRVVHRGALLPRGGGLDAFGHYAAESNLAGVKKVSFLALRALLDQFGALPPGTNLRGFDNEKIENNHGEWHYRADFDQPEPEPVPGVMEPGRPKTRKVDHYVLTVTKDGHASWSKQTEVVAAKF